MSTLHTCTVDRRRFGDLLSPEGIARLDVQAFESLGFALRRPPKEHGALAVWTQDPKETNRLPELLICDDGTESDWAAWITTFGARIRPFSAFTRLMPFTQFEKSLQNEKVPNLRGATWPAAGLVLGEVLAASGLPDRSLEALPASAFASTLSYAMFRAAAVYSDFESWANVVSAWEFCREVTRQRSRPIESVAVARICAAVLDVAGSQPFGIRSQRNDSDVRQACREIINQPEMAPQALSLIPSFSVTEEHMHGSREERVVAVNAFVETLSRTSAADPELLSFALGYLVSRIAPGTIQHASLLAPLAHQYADSYLWYGFCAALAPKEQGATNVAGHRPNVDLPASARRVTRDLLRYEPILGPPTCDIGVLELAALSRTSGDPLSGLVTTTQGTVTIELMPSVAMVVNVGTKTGTEAPARSQREKELLSRMGEQIDRIQDMYRSLIIGGDPPDDEPGQRSLFQTKRRKR